MTTLKDVAKDAGVSIASVSRLINKKGYISPDVKKRINASIKKLDYQPNLVARSLKLKSSNTIGLIFPDIEDPFFSLLAKKAEEIAYTCGYNVMLCNTGYNKDKERMYIQKLKERLVDGYIIIPVDSDTQDYYTILEKEKVVFVDKCNGDIVKTCIKLDNAHGVQLGMEHLISLGHTRIGVIHLPLETVTGKERYQGYKNTLKLHGIKTDKRLITIADSQISINAGYQETLKLLHGSNRPTAIFPMNGFMTIGALKAIRQLKLRIPQDISIIGFDEHAFSELLDPPLTTIAQPVEDFGKIAAETLIKLMKHKRFKDKMIVLKPELMVRQSCR